MTIAGHARDSLSSLTRIPVSVFVNCVSSRERWCWTTNERLPTRHSACPADSIEISRASFSDRPSSVRVSGTWLSSWW